MLILLFSCAKEEIYKTFTSAKIRQVTFIIDDYVDNIRYEYDENGLLIRGYSSDILSCEFEYDDLDRLSKVDYFYNSKLDECVTYQYDSNEVTRMSYFYPIQDTVNGAYERTVFYYDTQKKCQRIEYYQKDENLHWTKSDYNTHFTWNDGNINEKKHYFGDSLVSTETYQYDDKFNLEKLYNWVVSPWTQCKNNMISYIKESSNGGVTSYTFQYSYNDYGLPSKKVLELVKETHIEMYEYDFE